MLHRRRGVLETRGQTDGETDRGRDGGKSAAVFEQKWLPMMSCSPRGFSRMPW